MKITMKQAYGIGDIEKRWDIMDASKRMSICEKMGFSSNPWIYKEWKALPIELRAKVKDWCVTHNKSIVEMV